MFSIIRTVHPIVQDKPGGQNEHSEYEKPINAVDLVSACQVKRGTLYELFSVVTKKKILMRP